jgi:hypothetical protein
MSLKEMMSLEDSLLEQYETVGSKRQEVWSSGLSSVEKELKSVTVSYLSEERTRSAKIAELSRIKMLG